MSEKPRNLPQWMVKSDIKCSKDKKAETTKRKAKKRRSVVTYWMNERELVETALSILKDDQSRAGGAEEVMIVPETDEDTSDSDGQDRTGHMSQTSPSKRLCLMDTAWKKVAVQNLLALQGRMMRLFSLFETFSSRD